LLPAELPEALAAVRVLVAVECSGIPAPPTLET